MRGYVISRDRCDLVVGELVLKLRSSMLLPADNDSHLLFQRFELILDINEVFAILSVTRCKVLGQRLGLIKNFPYVLFLCEEFELMMEFEESRQTFDW